MTRHMLTALATAVIATASLSAVAASHTGAAPTGKPMAMDTDKDMMISKEEFMKSMEAKWDAAHPKGTKVPTDKFKAFLKQLNTPDTE